MERHDITWMCTDLFYMHGVVDGHGEDIWMPFPFLMTLFFIIFLPDCPSIDVDYIRTYDSQPTQTIASCLILLFLPFSTAFPSNDHDHDHDVAPSKKLPLPRFIYDMNSTVICTGRRERKFKNRMKS